MCAKHLFSIAAALVFVSHGPLAAQQKTRLTEWERGIAVEAPGKAGMSMYLWFYEWTMFEALMPGQHSQGTFKTVRKIDPEATEAVLELPALRLKISAVPGGADMRLEVTNTTGHDWPELAGIIPCWSPGRTLDARAAGSAFFHVPRNAEFTDPEFKRTFFVSAEGLSPLASRAIHFNADLESAIHRAADRAPFAFLEKVAGFRDLR